MTTEIASLFVRVGASISGLQSGLAQSRAMMQSTASSMQATGAKIGLAMGLPLTLAVKGIAQAGIDFESAFTGVLKTVGDASDSFGNLTIIGEGLRSGLREMAKDIPVAAEELAAIAEAGGQLGIESKNLLGFTDVIAKLGVATNLTSDAAASALAQFANITGMDKTAFDQLGSTIVALGNNMATTEADIVNMAQRIAGAGSTIGLSEHQILGFSAALNSVGINAEAGGSAISRVFVDMASSVAEGSDKLDSFARIAGLSAENFSEAFETDAASAMQIFIQGLGSVAEHGGNVFGVLEELDLDGIRVRDTMLRMAGAGSLLSDALGIAANEWEDNNALTREAALRFGTTESKMQLAKAAFKDIAITISDVLLPPFFDLMDTLGPLLTRFSEFASANPRFLRLGLILAGVGIALGPVIGLLGTLLGVVGALASPFGLLIAGGAALAAAWATDLGGLKTTMLGPLQELWHALTLAASMFEPMWEAIQAGDPEGFFASLGGFFTTFATQVPPALEKVWQAFSTWALSMGTRIIEMVSPWASAFMSWLDENKLDINTKLGAMLEKVWQAFSTWALSMGTRIIEMVSPWASAFMSWLDENKLDINTKLGAMLGKFTAWILTEGIPELIKLGAQLIGGLITGAAGMDTEGATMAGAFVTAFADAFAASEGWQRITETWGQLKLIVFQKLMEVSHTAKLLIAIPLLFMLQKTQEAWRSLILIWDLIKLVVIQALLNMSAAITTKLAQIKAGWTTAWNSMKALVLFIIEAIRAGVISKLNELRAQWETWVNNTLGWLASKRDAFVGIAVDWVQGMIDGFLSMAGKLAEAAASVLTAPVGIVLSALDISSPSRVMFDIGKNVGLGYAQGIAASRGAIVDASMTSLTQPSGISGGQAQGETTNNFYLTAHYGNKQSESSIRHDLSLMKAAANI